MQNQSMSINKHDVKVVLFHVFIAVIQAALIQLGKENFGSHTADVALFVQIASEAIRRFVV